MADDHEQSQSLAAAQEKVKGLTAAVRDLRREASRLQVNLDRLHKFQASLLEVSQRWLEWMERGDRLEGAHSSARDATGASAGAREGTALQQS